MLVCHCYVARVVEVSLNNHVHIKKYFPQLYRACWYYRVFYLSNWCTIRLLYKC